MRYALIGEELREAQPALTGECPGCRSPVFAKCGEVRVNHWAHRGRLSCDPWWEKMTEWHRGWQDQFPIEWRERHQLADDGEWHIADVRTDCGWVLEFQHSAIKPEERRSREAFYEKLIWVIDDTRRKTDELVYRQAYDSGVDLFGRAKLVDVRKGALFKNWAESDARVLVDFGTNSLAWLFPHGSSRAAIAVPISCEEFVQLHQPGGRMAFDTRVASIEKTIRWALNPRQLRERGIHHWVRALVGE